ncbi:hypothetical protein Ancab_017754 [Ancistrocladus abbreviatus]
MSNCSLPMVFLQYHLPRRGISKMTVSQVDAYMISSGSAPAASKKMSAGIFSTVIAGSSCSGCNLSSERLFPVKVDSVIWKAKTRSNGSRTHCMKTWNPMNNKKFETLSYLPPLSDDSIAKQIDYMLSKGWIPCLEFDEVGHMHRENSRMPGYYDRRYWTLWKLPMFGCNDSSHVLDEIRECRKTYPNAYIRCLAFDSSHHQGQSMAFLVHRPTAAAAAAGEATTSATIA